MDQDDMSEDLEDNKVHPYVHPWAMGIDEQIESISIRSMHIDEVWMHLIVYVKCISEQYSVQKK